MCRSRRSSRQVERIPGDAVGLVDRLRRLQGEARGATKLHYLFLTQASRAGTRCSPTFTSDSAGLPAASRSSSAAAAPSRHLPERRGHVEGDITAADVIGPNGQGIEPGSFGEILRAMRAGHAYANIHTTRWPGGEIRGQINDKDQREFDK